MIGQRYSPGSMGQSNFVCDHCPASIRTAWKIAHMDYETVLDILCQVGEVRAEEIIAKALEDRIALQNGVDSKILEAVVKDHETSKDISLGVMAIADKYIPRTRKSKFLTKKARFTS